MSDHPHARQALAEAELAGLRAIALIEIAKAILVVAAGIGFLYFRHHGLEHVLLGLVNSMHLDPASEIPTYMRSIAERAQTLDWHLIMLATFGYATLRAFEAYGLWFDLVWGNWIGALSGAFYLPFEAIECYQHPGWASGLLIVANVVIVAFLGFHLYHRKRMRRCMSAGATDQ